MSWILDAFKHFSVSKSLTFAAWMTSGMFVIGTYYFPNMPQVPMEWRWAPLAIFALASMLFVSWGATYLWQGIKSVASEVGRWNATRKLGPLTDAEEGLLRILGMFANESANLDDIARQGNLGAKLVVLAVSERLQTRGLAYETSSRRKDYLRLTDKGRKHVLAMSDEGGVALIRPDSRRY
jgi:predicted transcriptional regulator